MAKNLSAVWHIYCRPFLSNKIFWTIKVATVLDNSWPLFMILKHKGIISVYIKKVIASESSPFTKAPITPKEVTLKFSKGFDLICEFKKG